MNLDRTLWRHCAGCVPCWLLYEWVVVTFGTAVCLSIWEASIALTCSGLWWHTYSGDFTINQNLSSLSVSYDESGPGCLCGLLDELWDIGIIYLILGAIRNRVWMEFLGGLSLHLNHLIAERVSAPYRQFGTLPIGIFLSNLVSGQLETSLMTSYCHFWNLSTFGDSRAVWVFWPKLGVFRKSKFSRWRSDGASMRLGGFR